MIKWLIGVHNVEVGASVVQEHWPLLVFSRLVNAINLHRLSIGSVCFHVYLVCGQSSWCMVDFDLRTTFLVKTGAVEYFAWVVDVLWVLIQLGDVVVVNFLDIIVRTSVEVTYLNRFMYLTSLGKRNKVLVLEHRCIVCLGHALVSEVLVRIRNCIIVNINYRVPVLACFVHSIAFAKGLLDTLKALADCSPLSSWQGVISICLCVLVSDLLVKAFRSQYIYDIILSLFYSWATSSREGASFASRPKSFWSQQTFLHSSTLLCCHGLDLIILLLLKECIVWNFAILG